ncbi:MAG: hypothetical protein ABJO05_02775 [Roseibium sp.]
MPRVAVSTASVIVALEYSDLQLEGRDHRFGCREHCAGLREIGLSDCGTLFRRGEPGTEFFEFASGLGHGRF